MDRYLRFSRPVLWKLLEELVEDRAQSADIPLHLTDIIDEIEHEMNKNG